LRVPILATIASAFFTIPYLIVAALVGSVKGEDYKAEVVNYTVLLSSG